jgi:hypothetical protein
MMIITVVQLMLIEVKPVLRIFINFFIQYN